MKLGHMNRHDRDIVVERPSDADILAQLDRVVAGKPFNTSPKLANFLRFVVKAVIAGEGPRIKAYTIATSALGREASFDPQIDPIVRVEAGRLRRALARYYADSGRNDPLVIVIPRGTYVPMFRPSNVRPIAIYVRQMRSRVSGALREHYRLVLLIIAIAITLDVLGMLVTNALRPSLRNALEAQESETSGEGQPTDPG